MGGAISSKELSANLLERFLVVKKKIEAHKSEDVFEGLQSIRNEFEVVLKKKNEANVNYLVLKEQRYKEKQDYDSITSPTVLAYFMSKQDHERAIVKEKVYKFR